MELATDKRVLVAGATGYLGSRAVRAFTEAGARVRALVRPGKSVPGAAELFEGQVTDAATLRGACAEVDWVFSALGITRQRDGVTYADVDLGGNVALLEEAERSGVERFGVISVVDAERFRGNAMVDAKLRFLERLHRSRIPPRVVAATGFFRDMEDLLAMARKGTVVLFGDGTARCNPVDGADVAAAAVAALAGEEPYAAVGGPDVLTWNAVADLAFAALGKPARCRHVPASLARAVLPVARLFSPTTATALDFFVRVLAQDLVAPARGERRLADHFRALAAGDPA